MHWTYATAETNSDLEQGDILEPTKELRALLQSYHPYFTREQYLGFIVTTQSCDLVRRGDRPKAPHISIASFRSLRLALPQLLPMVVKPIAPGAFLKSHKETVRQFLERLLDQNEQGLGLFYLHPEPDIRLAEPSVVSLRVTVALKAEHYQLLCNARTGRLAPEFRAKLGWLVGNLYSRAASPDWSDHKDGRKEKERNVKQYLDSPGSEASFCWISDSSVPW